MNNSWALIKDGKVINTIVWEGPDASPMDFGKEVSYAEMPDVEGNSPSIGWAYDGKVYYAPPLTEEEIADKNSLKIANNIAMKSHLIAHATIAIAPLQDAVDLEEATEKEIAALKSWKQYRVAVNRVEANAPEDIKWPEQPE